MGWRACYTEQVMCRYNALQQQLEGQALTYWCFAWLAGNAHAAFFYRDNNAYEL